MEKAAYRRAYSDGIIDLFAGLSLMWLGANWIWLTDYAGFAGILPAILVPLAIAGRQQYIEKRLGYVQWSAPRRSKERRNLIVLYGAGVVLFFTGVIAFVVVDRSMVDGSVLDVIVPGLLGWLLALLALGLAVLMETWRFVLYGAVLAATAFLTGLQEANPGWPLLIAGCVVTLTGFAMLIAFIRSNPVSEGA
jgi:hypothetical protein